MKWRLGLDLGTNSLGWWAFELSCENDRKYDRMSVARSLGGGVLIFPDGREPSKGGRVGDGPSVTRRIARGMRRNRDRGKIRRHKLLAALERLGLLPSPGSERDALFQPSAGKGMTKAQVDALNPYRLRARAADQQVSAHELGRALAHLGLRRGFKSNRREASEDDGGGLKDRIDALYERLEGRTLGQYLADQLEAAGESERAGEAKPGMRFRAQSGFYPNRRMYTEEFERIRAVQAPHLDLGDDDWLELSELILDQRPLLPVERGRCEFLIEEPRHWRDTPVANDFRVFQELNNLRLVRTGEPDILLNAEQRSAILDLLMTRRSEVKFTTIRKLRRDDKSSLFPPDRSFNLEDPKRKGLKPHGAAIWFTGNDELAALWRERQSETGDGGRLDNIFEVLQNAEDDATVTAQLVEDFDVSPEAARALVAIKLSSATGRVSRRFMERVVPVLRDQGLVYSDAVAELTDGDGNPLHHSARGGAMTFDELPYYGQVVPESMLGARPEEFSKSEPEQHFGRINNPTVHVALNQLRRLVNHLVKRFGCAPTQIHVETTRELKQSRKQRDEITAKQAKNERENKRIQDLFPDMVMSGRDRLKVRLWEELGAEAPVRRCVFSGKTISAAQLFSGEVEIEHILPFSRTLDDGFANLTLAFIDANRLKGNRTPHEAFGGGQYVAQGYDWTAIAERASRLPDNKTWRFGPDAMQRFERDGGFIARQLTDTAHAARTAQRYLGVLQGVERVVGNPGRLTAMARGKWRLNGLLGDENRKNRVDHRHHAIDAVVIGLLDRPILQQVARASARGADDRLEITLPDLDDALVDTIRGQIRDIIVAYKPDHGLRGRLFKDTAYGAVAEDKRDPTMPEHSLVVRKAITGLSPREVGAVRDPALRAELDQFLYEATGAGLKHEKALEAFSLETGVKRVRILVKDQTATTIASAPYKAYAPDSYAFCDVWRKPKGKKGKWRKGEYEWEGKFWSYVDCAGETAPDKELKRPHPAAKFVTRLFKDDLVAYEEDGVTQVMRVAGFSTTNNKLDVKPHNLAVFPQTYVSINVLGAKGLRKLSIGPDGSSLRRPRRKP